MPDQTPRPRGAARQPSLRRKDARFPQNDAWEHPPHAQLSIKKSDPCPSLSRFLGIQQQPRSPLQQPLGLVAAPSPRRGLRWYAVALPRCPATQPGTQLLAPERTPPRGERS